MRLPHLYIYMPSRSHRSLIRRGILLCALALLAACHHPTWSPPRTAEQVTSADERELRRLMRGWWPAAVTRDRAYFERVLAPEFLWRRSQYHGYDWNREQFLQHYQALCGPGVTYQVTVDRYRLLGRHAVVSQAVTMWVGEPLLSRSEVELTHLFVKRRGRWQLLEGRYVWYQLPPPVWALPDTTLAPASAEMPFNPAERPVRLDTACREE